MRSLSNIETGVRTLRIVLYAVVICNVVTVLFAFVYTKMFVAKQSERIYALEGKASLMMALGQNVKENREAEAKAQLEEFHNLFFAVNPDALETRYNMQKAMKMSDASVANKYQQLETKGYYRQVEEAGVRIQYRCDSVKTDFTRYPYSAVVYGRTCINRQSSKTFRRLITTCELRNVSRTFVTPHGFLIENFEIKDNTDIKQASTIYEVRQ